MSRQKRLLWVDLEMTGLDERRHHIVEVAALVTDWAGLRPLEQMSSVVHQNALVLSEMEPVVRSLHEKSKLLDEIPQGRPLQDVENDLLAMLDRHFSPKDRIVLAGNSVSNDQRFIVAQMPQVAARLHYRVVDVSSFKEVFREGLGLRYDKKRSNHRALDDILESLAELKHYLQYIKVPNGR